METVANQVNQREPTADVVVIVNANARMGGDASLADERLEEAMRARGLHGRVQPTESEEACFAEVARAAREGVKVVVAAGGDGTVRSVVVGLMRVAEPRPALGILASGTMNNIAASFGIPEDLDAGLDLLAGCLREQRFFPMDVGMIGEQPFVEVAGVGLMARLFPIAEQVKSDGLRASGDLVRGVRELMAAQSERLTLWLDGRRVPVRALQVTLCNTPSHGARIVLSPYARIDDGLLDVVVDDRVSGPRMLWDMLARRDGRRMTRQRRRIFQARRVRIEQVTPWALQMDATYQGEYGPGEERRHVDARVEPGALRVCAPERPPTGSAAVAEPALQTVARLLPANSPLTSNAVESATAAATTAAQSVAQTVGDATQTVGDVAQAVQGAAQTVAEDVSQGVERRLTSPSHAVRTLRRMRWVYAPGIALGLVGAVAVRRWESLPGDHHVLRAVQRAHSPLADRVMTAVAAPGFPPLSVELLGAGAVALWLMRLRLEAGFLLAAAGGVTAVDVTLKRLIHRKRPTDGLARVLRVIEAPSFPSGHVMNYVSVFGFLTAATIANAKPSPVRTLITVGSAGMITLIGPARVYLGAHWPSDTLAGYLFGGLYLGGLLEAYTYAKSRQARRNEPR